MTQALNCQFFKVEVKTGRMLERINAWKTACTLPPPKAIDVADWWRCTGHRIIYWSSHSHWIRCVGAASKRRRCRVGAARSQRSGSSGDRCNLRSSPFGPRALLWAASSGIRTIIFISEIIVFFVCTIKSGSQPLDNLEVQKNSFGVCRVRMPHPIWEQTLSHSGENSEMMRLKKKEGLKRFIKNSNGKILKSVRVWECSLKDSR